MKTKYSYAQIKELYRQIAAGEGQHGDFLRAFAEAVMRSDKENFLLLLNPAEILILKYNLTLKNETDELT